MNYAIELLEEQQELLVQEMEFAEGEERTETTRRLVDVGNALNKLNLPVVVQQRELFYNFITWYNAKPNKDKNKLIFTSTIEEYLKL